jgi:hypothetical protein
MIIDATAYEVSFSLLVHLPTLFVAQTIEIASRYLKEGEVKQF